MPSDKHCCVPGCMEPQEGSKIVLHGFPNPYSDKNRFNTWLYAIGGDILALATEWVYKYRRVCHSHFEEQFHTYKDRLSKNAVPTLNMPDIIKKMESSPIEKRNPMKNISNLSAPSTSQDVNTQNPSLPVEVQTIAVRDNVAIKENFEPLPQSSKILRYSSSTSKKDVKEIHGQHNTEQELKLPKQEQTPELPTADVGTRSEPFKPVDHKYAKQQHYEHTYCINATGAEKEMEIAHEEEEEVWTEAEIMACEECGRPAETDGKLFQCVECPRVLCAQCERAERHRHHCMLRLPSRRIYDKMRILFESIREAVTARLTEDDDYDPDLEPKDEPIEPIEQDPLNTTDTEEFKGNNKPENCNRIIVNSLTLVHSSSDQISVAADETLPEHESVRIDKSSPIPSTVFKQNPIAVTRTVPKTKSLQALQTVIKPRSVLAENSKPVTRNASKLITSMTIARAKNVIDEVDEAELLLRPSKVAKSVLEIRSYPKSIPLSDVRDSTAVITVPEAKYSTESTIQAGNINDKPTLMIMDDFGILW